MGTDPEQMFPEAKAHVEAECRRAAERRFPDLTFTDVGWRYEPAHVVTTEQGDINMPDLWLFTVECRVEMEEK
jgi:hypothetical protein